MRDRWVVENVRVRVADRPSTKVRVYLFLKNESILENFIARVQWLY